MKKHLMAAALALGCGPAATLLAAQNEPLQPVIVRLHSDLGSASANRQYADSVARGYGLVANQRYGTVFTGFATRLPQSLLTRLAQDSRIASISADKPVRLVGPTTLACIPLVSCPPPSSAQVMPWGIARIGAPRSNTGAGVHVYVIDTGIDSNHPDLAGALGDGYAVERCLGLDCGQSWDDDQGHGTHVSGTIGARNNSIDVVGVAPGVTLHAVKVLNAAGSGSNSGVIAGIDWVAEQARLKRVPVAANMSLGGDGTKTGSCASGGFSGDDDFHRAVCNAKNLGVVFAVAAGNDGKDGSTSTPAAYDDAVITISATSSNNDWPEWSNWGDDAASWTSYRAAPVALAAPGADVLSLQKGGGLTTMSGTSMAAPHACGAMALALASGSYGADGSAFSLLRSRLLQTAASTSGFANTSGHSHTEPMLDVRSF